MIIASGLATMGIAVPGPIAAKLVRPQRRVVAVTGDGGLLMTSQELETAVRLCAPFVVAVLVDGRYVAIALNQVGWFGRAFGVALGNPDFVQDAASFGMPGFGGRGGGRLPAHAAAGAHFRSWQTLVRETGLDDEGVADPMARTMHNAATEGGAA